jgi:hypothetical protein
LRRAAFTIDKKINMSDFRHYSREHGERGYPAHSVEEDLP